jgi:SAM-dependent methyltransferase
VSLFFEIHRDLPREGPGDDDSTRRALAMVGALPPHSRILDVGCGPGMQTLVLASATGERIVAVDTHRPFLETLTAVARTRGLASAVAPLTASMFALPFRDGAFDMIWSEGAIYILGFERGLREWKRLLTPRGRIVVSELSWLKNTRPEECVRFWASAYPRMQSVDENLDAIRAAGYHEPGYFVLPERSWWDHYYDPLATRIAALRSRHTGDTAAAAQLDETGRQIELFRKYSNCYGYVFYIMQS